MKTAPSAPAVRCPSCGNALERGAHQGVSFLGCRRCRGVWFEPGVLARATKAERDLPALPDGSRVKGSRLACPTCRVQCDVRPYAAGKKVMVDQCPGCGGVWLDHGEFAHVTSEAKRLAARPDPRDVHGIAPDGQPICDDTCSILAHYDQEVGDDVTGTDYLLMLFLGIPKEFNMQAQRAPVINWALIAINLAAFAVQMAMIFRGHAAEVIALMFNTGDPSMATSLTSTFMHANVFHLFGNMVMLWMMGDNVEDHLGHAGYLGFYLVGGLMADLTTYAMHSGAPVNLLGASGAIAAVMAAYFIACPRAQIAMLVFFYPLRIPFAVFALLWVALQLVMINVGVKGIGVAAHLGGFAFGLVAYGLFRFQQWRRTGR